MIVGGALFLVYLGINKSHEMAHEMRGGSFHIGLKGQETGRFKNVRATDAANWLSKTASYELPNDLLPSGTILVVMDNSIAECSNYQTMAECRDPPDEVALTYNARGLGITIVTFPKRTRVGRLNAKMRSACDFGEKICRVWAKCYHFPQVRISEGSRPSEVDEMRFLSELEPEPLSAADALVDPQWCARIFGDDGVNSIIKTSH